MAFVVTILSGTGTWDQSLIPYRSNPRYMKDVNTEARARDYAAAAYHVSITRGEGGGCGSPAAATDWRPGALCPAPLNRPDLKTAWEQAVIAYRNAYNRLGTVADIRNELMQANKIADAAYSGEGVPAPRDPSLMQVIPNMPVALLPPPEPFHIKSQLGAKLGMAAAGVGILGAILAVAYGVGDK